MSVVDNENADRGLTLESAACERWPLAHVANDELDAATLETFEGVSWVVCGALDGEPLDWFDAITTAPITTPLGGTIVDVGRFVDVKACAPAVGRDADRSGRWWFCRENHDRLKAYRGWYALGVMDRSDVRRLALTSAAEVDNLLAGRWTNAGRTPAADRCAQLPWSAVFDRLDDETGGRA